MIIASPTQTQLLCFFSIQPIQQAAFRQTLLLYQDIKRHNLHWPCFLLVEEHVNTDQGGCDYNRAAKRDKRKKLPTNLMKNSQLFLPVKPWSTSTSINDWCVFQWFWNVPNFCVSRSHVRFHHKRRHQCHCTATVTVTAHRKKWNTKKVSPFKPQICMWLLLHRASQ